jgi:hypothetical protein
MQGTSYPSAHRAAVVMRKRGKIHPMIPWNDFDLSFNVDDILLGQGADPEIIRARKPALVDTAARALAEGLQLIQPFALVRQVLVKEHRHKHILFNDSNRLTGPLVTRHLAGAQRVAAVLCTIGLELEAMSNQLFATDPLMALALDGLGNTAVEHLGQQVCQRIGELAQVDGLTASTPLSPGEPDWPVEVGQQQIFALVEAARIGVQITSGGMMIPKKTISFVIGIGLEMSRVEPCEVCNLKESCRYRHA